MPNLLTFLNADAAAQADCAVITATGNQLTRAQLARIAADIAAFCKEARIKPNHRIGILLENCWQHPLLTLALSEICSVLPINPALTDYEIEDLTKDARICALLGAQNDARFISLALSFGCGVIGAALGADSLELKICSALKYPTQDRPNGLVLLTSGTTGLPKRVPITTNAMLQSAQSIANTLKLGPDDRAVHALPMFHIGAVVDLFLAPLLAGGSVVIANGQSPNDLDQAVQKHGGTWVQLVPTMLARCVNDLPHATRSQWGQALRFIRSVSSDLSPASHAASEAAFDGLPIIQMYGMSETAGQICSNPLPPAQRVPGTVGPATGPQIKILDAVGAPVPQGQIGEVCVSGPTVTQGYEGHDTADHFWSQWLRTGDLGHLDKSGFLSLTGRVKEMINRGGEKISPLDVERCILALPGVSEAAAYAQPHSTLGEQVGLSVVLHKDADLAEADLLAHLRNRLAEHKCPRTIDIREAMPRLGSGKVDRLALAGKRAASRNTALPDSPRAQSIAMLWQEIIGGPPPQRDDDFFDVGGDSLQATTFLIALEKRLGQTVNPNLLYESPRFEALVTALDAELLQAAPPREEASFLTYLRKQLAGWQGVRLGSHNLIIGQRMMGPLDPVFVITQGEHAELLPHLNPDRPAYLMRSLYGLKGKTETITRELAQVYTEEIQALRPAGPIYFLGYCEGAKLAHYIAENLHRLGRKTELIISIDHNFKRQWHGPVLHAHSEDWTKFRQPELGLGHLTTGGAALIPLSGKHVGALKGPSMPLFAKRIEAVLSGRETLPITATHPEYAIRHKMYQARITHQLSRLFKPGATVVRQVQVHNDSGVDWLPTRQSGISVSLDLHNLDGHLRKSVAGYGELRTPIPAGETAKIDLSITFPDKLILLQARLCMADEGICRFLRGQNDYKSLLLWPFGCAHSVNNIGFRVAQFESAAACIDFKRQFK